MGIGVMASIRLIKMKNMNKLLKILFHISIFSSIFTVLSIGIHFMLCINSSNEQQSLSGVLPFLALIGYLALFICILGTFLVRLRVTFEQSVYKMSKRTTNIFLTLYIIVIIFSIVCVTLWAILFFQRDLNAVLHWLSVVWALFIVICIIYISMAIAAVWIFCNNLLKLATLQSTSEDSSDLNGTQQKLVNMTTKYITLFGIASVSIFICFALHIVYHYSVWLYHVHIIATSIDCVISIVCLYLQYSFASHYYDGHCRKLHDCCKRLVVLKMLKSISRKDGYDGCPSTETAEIETK